MPLPAETLPEVLGQPSGVADQFPPPQEMWVQGGALGKPNVTETILKRTPMRQTLFTGSSNIAEHLAKVLNGKIRIEDAGFDWKVLGPDVPKS